MSHVLVVGGGTSGSVLAARLSEEPSRQVTLVEAGPGESAYDDRVRDPSRAVELFGGGGIAEVFAMDAIAMVRGTCLGGTSAVNFLAACRGKPGDFSRWGPGWSWDDLLPAYERAEAVLRPTPWAPLSRAAQAFVDGVPAAQVLSASLHPDGTRRTVSQAYLTDDVRARPNLTIRTGEHVDVVSRDLADEVIVCAGATRTPALLQRSGIACGHGLQDHLGISATYRHPSPSGLAGSPAQVLWDGGDVHLIPTVVADDGEHTYVTVLAFLLDLDDRGRVDGDVVTPQRRGPRDVARLHDLVERLAAWETSDPFLGLVLERLGDLPDPEAAPLVSYGHQAGTCAIGDVLDQDCRVVGNEWLRVCDASAMPRLVSNPPYLTCVAMAELLASRFSSPFRPTVGRNGDQNEQRSLNEAHPGGGDRTV